VRGKKIIWTTIAFAMLLGLMPLAIPVAVASTPHVYIDPAVSTPEVWTQFTVDIKIAGVIDNDIYTWGLRLSWDAIMLKYVSVAEGPYLAEVAPEGTFFIEGELPPAANYKDFACSILGPYAGASGDGTLATVTFEVLDIGTTTIHISEVQLIDSGLHLKPYTTTDGVVNVHTDWIANPDFTAILVEKRVDCRTWSISIKGTLITFYGKVKNLAWVPLYVKVRFAGTTPIGKRTYDTAIANIQPNDVSGFLTYGQGVTMGMRGKWTFTVYAMYSYGGSRWFANTRKVETLTFRVID